MCLTCNLDYLEREFDFDRDLERDREGLRDGLRLPEGDLGEPERDLADLFEAALRDLRETTLPASEPLPEKLLASESDIVTKSQ